MSVYWSDMASQDWIQLCEVPRLTKTDAYKTQFHWTLNLLSSNSQLWDSSHIGLGVVSIVSPLQGDNVWTTNLFEWHKLTVEASCLVLSSFVQSIILRAPRAESQMMAADFLVYLCEKNRNIGDQLSGRLVGENVMVWVESFPKKRNYFLNILTTFA